MRYFKTGGTRSNDDKKIDYRHESALESRFWCEYMHKHRIQEDGKLREPDNYKKGLSVKSYIQGMNRHKKDLDLILEGFDVIEQGKKVNLWEALLGLSFNIRGLTMELAKHQTGGKIERNYDKLIDDDKKIRKFLEDEMHKK